MKSYSVIIPALNEEENIGNCIKRIRSLNGSVQVIVSDGGSTDQTRRIAETAGTKVICSAPGRGVQCNSGARESEGEILVFLHADTLLPQNCLLILEKFFTCPEVVIGTFRLRFDNDHWFLKVCGYLTRFDSIFTRFGDQCIVIRKNYFNKIGGFADWPLFEDVDFLCRARRNTKIYSFPAEVITSARKFVKNGPIRQQIKNSILIMKYMCGESAFKLAAEYKK